MKIVDTNKALLHQLVSESLMAIIKHHTVMIEDKLILAVVRELIEKHVMGSAIMSDTFVTAAEDAILAKMEAAGLLNNNKLTVGAPVAIRLNQNYRYN